MSSTSKALAAVLLLFTCFANADQKEPEPQKLVNKAAKTLQSFLAREDMQWLREHISDAAGVMIIPRMITAGFVVAGSGGDAVLLARDAGSGAWSDPAFYRVGGFSVGLQIGGEAAEAIVLVRTNKALNTLMTTSGKFSLAGSMAVGPVGGGASVNIATDMVSYTQNKGAFAGVSLGANAVEPNVEFNQAYYGKDVGPRSILIDRSASNPGAQPLKDTLAGTAK